MCPLAPNEIRDAPLESTNARLITKVLRLVPEAGKFSTAIDGLYLTRRNEADQTDICFYEPAIGLILQGHKESVIGNKTFAYGAFDCLVNGVDMPSVSRVISASPQVPLLAVSLNIDKKCVTELAAEMPPVPSTADDKHLGVSVSRVSPDVLDAFSRLVDELDSPERIALLAPLLIREIISRVLMGPQGEALRMLYTPDTHGNQVAEAITWLRSNYRLPLQIDALAAKVRMATSTFHRQFKKVTSLSPLQFQKYLRLYEAQRLMLAENLDANNAGRSVGYESVQQFSREYKRKFGNPPHRDVKRLRAE